MKEFLLFSAINRRYVMAFSFPRNKPIKLLQLVMINVIAIDSLRNLPANAVMGFGLPFFYLIGALFFLLPSFLPSSLPPSFLFLSLPSLTLEPGCSLKLWALTELQIH